MTIEPDVGDGFVLSHDDDPSWPQRPVSLRYMTAKEREEEFGSFTYKANPDGSLVITGRKNFVIKGCEIPQLKTLGFSRVNVNERASDRLVSVFQLWDDLGLMSHVLSWDGLYVPRFVRGSTVYVSNHAWGTAFDINARWNPLGRVGPLAGQKGSTRMLIESAAQCGWISGAWFDRPDYMHFEIGKEIIKED